MKQADIEKELQALIVKLCKLAEEEKDENWVFCLRVCDDGSGQYDITHGMEAYEDSNPFSLDSVNNFYFEGGVANNKTLTWYEDWYERF